MNFASSHIFLTIKTKFGTNWKSERDVAISDWPTPLHADRPRWPLDLNEICGLDQSWELTKKKTEGGGASPAAITLGGPAAAFGQGERLTVGGVRR
jgi:hypothetical protein